MMSDPTSLDVRTCAEHLKTYALDEMLRRSTAVESYIRTYMGEHFGRCDVTKIAFEEAVRLYLGDLEWQPRTRRPVEFSEPVR